MSYPKRRGRWRLIAAQSAIVVGLLVGSSVVTAPAQAAVQTNGLKAEYFTLGSGADFAFDELKSTVLDGEVNYGNLVPVFEERTGQRENAGVRWTGSLNAPTDGEYTFYAIGDNGMRLWIDGEPVIDFWEDKWDQEQTSAPVTLTAGEHDFKLENFQATGGAYLQLSWAGPGIDKSIVPLSAFTPPADFEVYPANAAVNVGGDTVVLELDGEVGGADAAGENLTLLVDQTEVEITATTADAAGVAITPIGSIYADTSVRLKYDGEGSLTVDGEPAGAFDIPVLNDSDHSMTTPWAEDVDPNNPLPEYPRPQLERSAWQNLNGVWQFEAATADSATPFGADLAEEVVVPFPIESEISGVERHEDHMVYRRAFDVPADWGIGSGQRLQLNFGAVDYDSTVYVNGTEVVSHSGGFDAFSADVTDALVDGSNELVVRVSDDTANQPKGKQTPNPSGIFYTPASGIWQTVWMEPVAAAHIDRLQLTPDVDASSLTVNAVSESASADAEVTVTAFDADGAEVGTATGSANADLSVSIPDAQLWSPENPYLYTLTATLSDNGTSDTVSSYSGMRSIDVEEVDGTQRITLNGNQTFLLSTLDQGYWPDGVYTAPTDEALAWDIQATKDLGFNTIRKHIKVEPQRWYLHADQIGMLVWQDMPTADNGDEDARNVFRAELAEMIEEFGSTTSIIGWVPMNEGWGEWEQAATGEIADDVKAQDPSRLVNAHSGVNCCNSKGDSGKGDIIDWHQYTGPALPHPDATRAAIDGEHGGFSLSDPAHTWPGGSVNPYGEVETSEQLTAAYVENTAKLVGPAQEYLSGSIYTQITDVEGEVNGFWTYDRHVLKMDLDQVKAINEKVIEVGSKPRPLPEPAPGDDGVAYWPLDEGSGTESADASGNDNTLTLAEGTTWDEGVAGSAIALDGTGQDATASVSLDTTGDYSVSAWVRMDALPADGQYATIASADGLTGRSAFFLQYGDPISGFAFSFAGGPRAVLETTPELGTWHHLVGVRDVEAGNISLYVDGELAATEATDGGTASSGTIALGRGQWDGDAVDFLNGAVDDVHVFDGVLSADDVAALAAPPVVDPIAVVPAAVTFSDVSGTKDDTYTIPESEGVEYLVGQEAPAVSRAASGEVVAAGTYPAVGDVTVTARSLPDYALADDAVTEWSFSFSDAVDPGDPTDPGDPGDPGDPSDPGAAGGNDGDLATTGGEIAWTAALAALALLLVGGFLIHRRRASSR